MNLKIVYSIALFTFLFSCGENRQGESQDKVEPIVYFCGAEDRLLLEEDRYVFRNNLTDFQGANYQTSEFSFEGDYAVKLDSKQLYGMTFILTDIKKDAFFKASVWQKESAFPGALICSIASEIPYTFSSLENGFYEKKNGWMKHTIQFRAVTDIDSATFFLFAGNSGKACFFDNLEVKQYTKKPVEITGEGSLLSLVLPDSSWNDLDSFKRNAIKEETIREAYKQYVDGSIDADGKNIPIEIRLKGDWTDHLMSGNASYRIKTASNYAYKGLRSFSIQHPKTRNYMHEWFMHKLCDSHDVLSTKYSFLYVSINDEKQGVYALEEHFDKQLLESRNRREGPILKIDESGFWALVVMRNNLDIKKIDYPFYEAAIASTFKKNRVLKSKNLRNQFYNGAILINLFKNNYSHPEQLFDMQQIATYLALMDLGNVHHSLAWHNMRFYYNPITAKLEIIGFDMVPMVMPFNVLLATKEFNLLNYNTGIENWITHNFYRNSQFREKYTKTLFKISSISYLDSVFNEMDSVILLNEELMALEMEGYLFDRSLYYKKAELIREELETIDRRWDNFLYTDYNHSFLMEKVVNKYKKDNSSFYLKEVSVNAFRSKMDTSRFLVEFENYHPDSVRIIGYSIKDSKNAMIPFEAPINMAGFYGGALADTASIVLPTKPSRFFFKLANLPNEIKKKKFIKWKKPSTNSEDHPRIALENAFQKTAPYYTIDNNTVRFNTGVYQINQLVFIPKGYEVIISQGTNIDFINGGGLIINGITTMIGSETEKITFTSTDSTGMGITILQAGKVDIAHVSIDNMNTLDYKGWVLTGAITIYESPVFIEDLHIKNNLCEDGLNIIRSHFQIKNCLIEATKSDGFDADFCTGFFSNSVFKNTGNDCIDFSGSTVEINNIEIYNSGDKGISAGERSKLTIKNIKINGAITGIASKDDSFIEGTAITINSAEVGLAIFQKKPEYGGSTIHLSDIDYTNIERTALIEKGSHLEIDGKSYKGYQIFDIDEMYARF